MKKATVFVSIPLIVLLATSSWICAGDLDTYYLSRFGGLRAAQLTAAGYVNSRAVPLFERCGTPSIRGLRQDWPKLQTATQAILAKELAYPVYDTTYPSTHFTIHYSTSGSDAFYPPVGYSTVLSWVQKVAETFEYVYQKELTEMGYKNPVSPDSSIHVYLRNIGSQYLGVTDAGYPGAQPYITIENDFVEFPSDDPVGLLQITAAHEFHHVIQFSYTYWFDMWYAEATSTWIEDEVYDGVNQLYDYLTPSFHFPGYSLNTQVSTTTGGGYGRWLFNRYLAERFAISMVRQMWEAVDGAGNGSDINMMPYLESQLRSAGSSLAEVYVEYAKQMYQSGWTTHRNETGLFPPLLATSYSSYPVNARTVPAPAGFLYPYAFVAYSFTPSHSSSGSLVLTIGNRTPGLELALFRTLTGGAIQELAVDQSAATVTVPGFFDGGISKATLLVINPTERSGLTFTVSTDGTSVAPVDGTFNPAGITSLFPYEPDTTDPSSSSGGGDGGGGGCFIATAAYGSYLHPKVMELRGFRDRWLMTNPVGRILVNFYYRVSPPMANIISRHEWMRMTCRWLLTPLVGAVQHPESFALLVPGLLGWVLIRRRVAGMA